MVCSFFNIKKRTVFGSFSDTDSFLKYLWFAVPRTGIEPVPACADKILSLACLPIPPPRQNEYKTILA